MSRQDQPIRSSADQVAERLSRGLRDGRYGDRLPGYRVLCREFGVSRGVVNTAMAILEENRVLRAGGARRRREAEEKGAGPSQGAGKKPERTVLLLSMDAENDPHALLNQNLPNWRAAIEKSVGPLQVEFLDAVHAKRPRRRWDELIARIRPERLVLLAPPLPVSRWAIGTGIRTVCLGGVSPDTGADSLGFSTRDMVRRALEELFACGHRDVMMPLAGRLPEFAEMMRNTMRTALDSHGIRYVERLHAPLRAEGDGDIFREMLLARLRERMPSAILLFDAHEVAAAQWVLQSRGLRIPDMISLIVLGDLPQAAWWAPHGGPARFRFDEAKLTTLLVRRLLAPATGPDVRETLEPDFIPGGTLAAARAAD